MLLAVLFAARADAQPQIKVHCEIYATNHVDSIAFTSHLHNQIGNTFTTNDSTANSFSNNPSTSCDRSWFTSAGWFPVERYEPVSGVNVYYHAPGDQTKIKAILLGLQLLATQERYNCNPPAPFRDTPYNCTDTWMPSINFPDYINTSKLSDEAANVVYGRVGVCPSTHPYRIPRIDYLISHPNSDGKVANPLTVSAGLDSWEAYTFMQGDYFAANQSVFNSTLLDLCLRNAPDSVIIAHPRCG